MRIRGAVATLTDSGATLGLQQTRVGVLVEPTPNATAGTLDGPFGGEHRDWMLFEPFITPGGGQGGFSSDCLGRIIDSKGARKLEEIEEQLSLFVQASVNNSDSVSVVFDLSIGIKLP